MKDRSATAKNNHFDILPDELILEIASYFAFFSKINNQGYQNFNSISV